MSFRIDKKYRDYIDASVKTSIDAGELPSTLNPSILNFVVEVPKDAKLGDLSSNIALTSASVAKMPPRTFASIVAKRIEEQHPEVKISIAGPGFINFTLEQSEWQDQLKQILQDGSNYGSSNVGAGQKVNVEYVSANPTGPMHVGHGRGAVVGDALAALYEKTGFDVTREYYINDAGAQVDQLARSVHLRYREALGEIITEIPEGLYPGDYLKTTGAALAARDGRKWMDRPEAEWIIPIRQYAVSQMMKLIQDDLAAAGIHHAVFTSERMDVVEKQRVAEVVDFLRARDLVYTGVLEPPKGMKPEDWEPRPQLLFRATKFGDDVDRPLQKSDGSWTYFAADMAYHLDKFRRGFTRMIDVWGADHGGYVKRMTAAVAALSDGKATLEVKLCQLVNLLDKGQPVKMSKRAGTFVTLRDVIDEVGARYNSPAAGAGVVRFIMLTRKHDQHLDFDLAKVTEQSKDNPVFYVQYAHARTRSAFRQARAAFPNWRDGEPSDAALAAADLARLSDTDEIALIKTLAGWPRLLESAADAGEPHRVAFFLYDLASAFHALWTRGKDETQLRFVVPDDQALTLARLALVRGVGLVIASGLRLIGVEPAEEMR